eukprot:gb/GFBE01032050.1/.p1 GENE.gb/GFBE01032050.1/~~gb/GFBE01032050.1/.p1  ORF type:complete len:322 (+),score=93.70 gb/GFBE01032050.1/:1-966(+)
MGCGASIGPASDAQKQEMASKSCYECICVCVQRAVNRAIDEKCIKISAPTAEIEELRKASKKIRESAESLKSGSGEEAAEGGNNESKVAEGGVVASALGALGAVGQMASDLAGKAKDAVTAVATTATHATMTALADALDAPINKLDEQFSKVAVEVVTEKRVEIVGAYNAVLVNCEFYDAMKTVRGDDYDYAHCPKDRVSVQFMSVCKDNLMKQLSEAVMAEVEKSLVVNTWKQACEQFNACTKCVGSDAVIKLDICQYIVNAIFEQLTEEMKKCEEVVRADPSAADSKQPDTFKRVFSSEPLNSFHYKEFKDGKRSEGVV